MYKFIDKNNSRIRPKVSHTLNISRNFELLYLVVEEGSHNTNGMFRWDVKRLCPMADFKDVHYEEVAIVSQSSKSD